MRMNKAVIFDWGGVLMRTLDYSSRHAWDHHLGLPSGAVESIVHGVPAWEQAQRGAITPEAYWEVVRESLGLDSEALAALREDFYIGDRLDKALVELIVDLHEREVLVGLLSNNTLDLYDALAAFELDQLFDAVVISAEIGLMKPDPAAYQAVLKRLGVAPHQAIFVDDFPANVDGARSVGMEAVRFTPDLDLAAALDSWLST
jgi:epoxide hydrolase-like predicted phosphatase